MFWGNITYEQQNEGLLSILREKLPRRQPWNYISSVLQGCCGTQISERSSDIYQGEVFL